MIRVKAALSQIVAMRRGLESLVVAIGDIKGVASVQMIPAHYAGE